MTRKCDKYLNFYVSPCGTVETCNNKYNDPYPINNQSYYDERINGNQTYCKYFVRLRDKFK